MLEGFPVVAEVTVRWADMDALGHVNHARYLRYFEIARLEYLLRLGLDPPGPSWGEFGVIIASLDCRFLAPITFPDTLSVGARILSMAEDRCTMEHVAVSQKLERAAAQGTAVIVAYDYDAGKRRPLPRDVVQRIEALEGREFHPEPERDGADGR